MASIRIWPPGGAHNKDGQGDNCQGAGYQRKDQRINIQKKDVANPANNERFAGCLRRSRRGIAQLPFPLSQRANSLGPEGCGGSGCQSKYVRDTKYPPFPEAWPTEAEYGQHNTQNHPGGPDEMGYQHQVGEGTAGL